MMRPIADTCAFLHRKLRKKQPLSLRKQMCVQYLKWRLRKEDKDAVKFARLAIQWRKEEREIGGARTLLEKRARKLISKVRADNLKQHNIEKGKKIGARLREEGRGVCDPAWLENRREAMKHIQPATPPHVKDWIIYPPDSEPFVIHNLVKFCRENGLCRKAMGHTANTPHYKKTHKGWRAAKYRPDWENFEGDG
jgi:hypothetical protein